jgi:hypothetical protein
MWACHAPEGVHDAGLSLCSPVCWDLVGRKPFGVPCCPSTNPTGELPLYQCSSRCSSRDATVKLTLAAYGWRSVCVGHVGMLREQAEKGVGLEHVSPAGRLRFT